MCISAMFLLKNIDNLSHMSYKSNRKILSLEHRFCEVGCICIHLTMLALTIHTYIRGLVENN